MNTPLTYSAKSAVLNLEKAQDNIGDMDTVLELLQMMRDMLTEELPLAQAALDQADLPGFKAFLHRWNGSLGHFVEDSFAAAVQEVERNAGAANAPWVKQNWPVCRDGLHSLSEEIAALTRR